MTTFTNTDLKQLEEDIRSAGYGRSLSAHKGDVLKFVLAYFSKQAKSNQSSSPSNDKNEKLDKNIKGEKKDEKKAKKKDKKSGSSDDEDKKKYTVMTVNGNKYKASTSASSSEPISAARKMAPKIRTKMSLSDSFVFQIKEIGGCLRTYKCEGEEVTQTSA